MCFVLHIMDMYLRLAYYLCITCLCTLFSLDELIFLHFASFSYVVHVLRELFTNHLNDSNIYYLQITSHVSHDVTSYTHFTSYFLLKLVHEIMCEFSLAFQDYIFYDFDTKYVQGLKILE